MVEQTEGGDKVQLKHVEVQSAKGWSPGRGIGRSCCLLGTPTLALMIPTCTGG